VQNGNRIRISGFVQNTRFPRPGAGCGAGARQGLALPTELSQELAASLRHLLRPIQALAKRVALSACGNLPAALAAHFCRRKRLPKLGGQLSPADDVSLKGDYEDRANFTAHGSGASQALWRY
jgi:hypothetical protein